ncbi:hypothetical protein CDAR_546021 [Caerostris darwini]|uniref:Uncharacterized protein n=1 Tax=Caerostris darwini TaxID=1538125 RepID=A0AAV4X4D2_9ARAC|nr:hypothetical protein CDAR_546021 [Caerostris darwini]
MLGVRYDLSFQGLGMELEGLGDELDWDLAEKFQHTKMGFGLEKTDYDLAEENQDWKIGFGLEKAEFSYIS